MTSGRWMSPFLGALLVVGAFTVVAMAQLYEERQDPAELGIGDIGELAIPASTYVGNDACRSCHPGAYGKWISTMHARAFVPLRSRVAQQMGKEAGMTVCCAEKSGLCLQCHATAHDVPARYREAGFRMGEGVTCERCHGPGGAHVRAMQEGDGGGPEAQLVVPTKDLCMTCHRSKPDHAVVHPRPYSLTKAWKEIAHGGHE
jgi:hypothetical protein